MTATIEISPRNVKYLGTDATPNTANLAGFAAWVSANVDTTSLKTKSEHDAFALGVKAAGLKAKFEEDRRVNGLDPTVLFLDYVLGTTGVDLKTDKARAAFAWGVGCNTLYRKYQISKKAVVAAEPNEVASAE